MKNLLYLIIFFALVVSFGSCKDEKDNEAWREANISAYEAITKDPQYKALETETGPKGVYYKVIKSGTGTEHPIQTSKVKALYTVYHYDRSIFDPGTSRNNIPIEIAVFEEIYSGVTTPRGFSFALQNMVVGDKWEVWVPYYLAFGAYGIQEYSYYYYQAQTIVRGYTTLIYEVELIDITQYPK